jgi:hypothetical protein
MKQLCEKMAMSAAIILGSALLAQVDAAPPTATPSPGYDARLQEQHAAQAVQTPAPPTARGLHRRTKPSHYHHD